VPAECGLRWSVEVALLARSRWPLWLCVCGGQAQPVPCQTRTLAAYRPGARRLYPHESHGVQVPLCLAGAWPGSLGAHTPLESTALALNCCTSTVRRRTTS